MTRLGVLVLSLVLGGAVILPGACSAAPGSNARCVFESGDVATGRCLTECESRCALESAAGCAPSNCVKACETESSSETGGCADADYAHWRCLRTAALPRVSCDSNGNATFDVPANSCRTELERENVACIAVDAGTDGDRGR